jgi:dipeptidyl aminopeptidase/acylaminoacyl peptidase
MLHCAAGGINMAKQEIKGGQRHSNQVFFKNAELDLYAQAFLGYEVYGEAAVGEYLYAIKQVDERDPQTWTRAWQDIARTIQTTAERSLEAGHTVSVREAFLRAYIYYRISSATLHAYSDEFRQTYDNMVHCYRQAMPLFEPPIEPVEIAFEGHKLPGYYMRPDIDGTPKATIIVIGGGETYVEDNYFWGGAAGLRRGYNVLTVDMPGQGATAFRGMHHRADTEKPFGAAIDWLEGRPEVDMERLGTFGVSLGGYITIRAAAFDKRIKACAASTPIPDFHGALRDNMPAALRALPSFATNAAIKMAGMACPSRWTNSTGRWASSRTAKR